MSGVRALHIEQGFSDPLPTAFTFKGCSAVSSTLRAPRLHAACLLPNLILVIWQSLDLCLPDHLMFWAACSLWYSGILRASELKVPSLASFSPSCHLGVQDIVVDSLSAPSCMPLKIKVSKTDSFRKGAFIHIGLGRPLLCSVHLVM